MAGAEFIGGDAIRAKLQNLLNAKPQALKAAGVSLLTASQKSIIQSGPGWPPFKRQPKRAHKLLWDTGTMLRSLALGDSGNVIEQDDNSITVGSNIQYTAAQNLGVPSHDLPARPFLFIDDARLAAARDAYLNQIKLAWNK